MFLFAALCVCFVFLVVKYLFVFRTQIRIKIIVKMNAVYSIIAHDLTDTIANKILNIFGSRVKVQFSDVYKRQACSDNK